MSPGPAPHSPDWAPTHLCSAFPLDLEDAEHKAEDDSTPDPKSLKKRTVAEILALP